jgi:hypothetical protein
MTNKRTSQKVLDGFMKSNQAMRLAPQPEPATPKIKARD